MVGLDHLPDEILGEMIRFLTSEKATLCCLATVNKKLSGLAIQALAYDIDICVQTEETGKRSYS